MKHSGDESGIGGKEGKGWNDSNGEAKLLKEAEASPPCHSSVVPTNS